MPSDWPESTLYFFRGPAYEPTLFSWTEARRFYAIGLPIFIAQLSQVGMNFADTAMTGQASAEDMAAVAVAGSIWAPLSLLGLGSLFALPPLTAQMVARGTATARRICCARASGSPAASACCS